MVFVALDVEVLEEVVLFEVVEVVLVGDDEAKMLTVTLSLLEGVENANRIAGNQNIIINTA